MCLDFKLLFYRVFSYDFHVNKRELQQNDLSVWPALGEMKDKKNLMLVILYVSSNRVSTSLTNMIFTQ